MRGGSSGPWGMLGPSPAHRVLSLPIRSPEASPETAAKVTSSAETEMLPLASASPSPHQRQSRSEEQADWALSLGPRLPWPSLDKARLGRCRAVTRRAPRLHPEGGGLVCPRANSVHSSFHRWGRRGGVQPAPN